MLLMAIGAKLLTGVALLGPNSGTFPATRVASTVVGLLGSVRARSHADRAVIALLGPINDTSHDVCTIGAN